MRHPMLIASALLLTACQHPSDDAAPPPSIEPTVAQISTSDCDRQGNPTVVRYHSRLDTRTQHSVHLLNPGDTALRGAGCDPGMPVASIVTLRYRVAGS